MIGRAKKRKTNWKTNAKKHGQVFDTSTLPSPSRSIAFVQRLQKIFFVLAEVCWSKVDLSKIFEVSWFVYTEKKDNMKVFLFAVFSLFCLLQTSGTWQFTILCLVNIISLDLLQLHKFVAQTLASATCNRVKPEIFLLRKCVISVSYSIGDSSARQFTVRERTKRVLDRLGLLL